MLRRLRTFLWLACQTVHGYDDEGFWLTWWKYRMCISSAWKLSGDWVFLDDPQCKYPKGGDDGE